MSPQLNAALDGPPSRHRARLQFRAALITLLVLAGGTGCSALPPVHAYEGPQRAREALARVTALSRHEHDGMTWIGDRLFIASVDDRPTYDPFALTTATDPETVYVLPGEHRFGIHWVSPRGVLTGDIRFRTEAGHNYLILQALEDGRLKLWVEDVTERQIMARAATRGAAPE